ncbi:MAG: hypothetical protein M3O71_21105 [Bacteroidota bacterium]|nr:hypothetical protein [Bacteroidota bacterium]
MNYEKTTNGVMYTGDITSINGASFILFPEGKHTVKMIKEAITELMNSRDVVSMRVANEDDRDELYRTEIFRHPATRPLKWYEINADDKQLLRAERLKGTSADNYVNWYVLPFTEQTKLDNLERFGDKIFEI